MAENTVKMTISQMHTVTRSFSKKVNLERHVPGFKYESEDFFSSHNESIPMEEVTPERVLEVSKRLYELAKADVEAAVALRVRELQRNAGVQLEPTQEEYSQMKDIVLAFESADTQDKVNAAIALVQEKKDKFNDVQLDYLRELARKSAARQIG